MFCFSRESQYFPHSHLRQNIWLDQKSHDRIQNWLSDNHEFTGYHPPDEEGVLSIRSNSAVDISSYCEHSAGDENYFNPVTTAVNEFIPKYKSEERIQRDSSGEDNNSRRAFGFRRYNSPDCIRRRYFSPRSDPTLNIPKPAQHLSSEKQFNTPPRRINNNDLPYHEQRSLNRAFYQSGKGNTFPRRNKYAPRNRGIPRQLLNATVTSQEEMGQQMEKHQPMTYNGGVVLNPYASGTMKTDNNNAQNDDNAFHTNDKRKHNRQIQQDNDIEKPLLVGRTFVLNGISIQAKQDNTMDAVNSSQDSKNSPRKLSTRNSNDAGYSNVSNDDGILNKLSSTNHKGDNSIPSNDRADDFVLSNDRIDHLMTSTIEKGVCSNSDNHRHETVSSSSSSSCEERRELPRPIARTAFHVRVVSAPATTDSNKLDSDIYWRNNNETCHPRRVPSQVRKVKAFSWPKRAVLPTQSADAEFVANLTKKRLNHSSSFSGSSVRSRETRGENEKHKLLDGQNESVNNSCTGLEEMDYVNISVGDLLEGNDDSNINNVDDNMSENSDIPPARPPLPADHIFSPHRRTSISSDNQEHSRRDTQTHFSASSSQSNINRARLCVEEDAVIAETHVSVFEKQSELLQLDYLSDDYTSNSSLLSDHFHRKDLSKSVSMSLKDLIRIHEQEIARVSGAVSTRTLDKIDELVSTRRDSRQEILLQHSVRRSSYDSITREAHINTKWKRHTTLGLPTKFVAEEEDDRMTDGSSTSAVECCANEDAGSSFEYVTSEPGNHRALYSPKLHDDRSNHSRQHSGLDVSTTKTRLSSSFSEQDSLPPPQSPHSPCVNVSNIRSPPSTLPKPKKRVTSVSCSIKRSSSSTTSVTKTLDEELVDSSSGVFATNSLPPPSRQSQRTDSTTTVESAVQTEVNGLERSASFRRNEKRVRELMVENETIRKDFEEERDDLTKKLQEQKKVANAYQKLEDRYRRKVYELQKAMKMCTCSSNRIYPGEGNHYSYRYVHCLAA